jgi:hypothetical protein
MLTNTHQAPQLPQDAVVGSALKLLDSNEIDISRYYKIDEFYDETEIDEAEFKDILNRKEKCGFEFYLEVDYSVPIDYDSTDKKSDSCEFFEDCYSFPFSEEVLKLLDELGYDDDYLKNWVKQYYGKPDYEQIWDGETLYDEDYLDEDDEVNYLEVWKVYDYFKIELFND